MQMRRCLLLPQHWAQEAGDKQTWMELKRQWPYYCVLNWKGGKEERKQFPTSRRPACRCFTRSHLQRTTVHLRNLQSNESLFLWEGEGPSISWLPRPDGWHWTWRVCWGRKPQLRWRNVSFPVWCMRSTQSSMLLPNPPSPHNSQKLIYKIYSFIQLSKLILVQLNFWVKCFIWSSST